MHDVELELCGEELRLLPERAIYWARTATLLLADAHLGKAASFRAAALGVPEELTVADLTRLSGLLERTGARRLVVLGDLLHARSGRAPNTMATIAAWRAAHARVELLLVRGNHDRGAGDPPAAWGMSCVDEPLAAPPFALCHYPTTPADGYVLAGHIHPAVVLAGAGRQRERLPCFLFGERVGLLPAFGSFTGSGVVRPERGDRVFVVADDAVIAI